jgi:subtilisin family serine protease
MQLDSYQCRSTTKADSISSFSNSATFLSLLASGYSILSSLPDAEFGFLSGTSMATTHVAGAWAILKQSSPAATVSANQFNPGAVVCFPRIIESPYLPFFSANQRAISAATFSQPGSLIM